MVEFKTKSDIGYILLYRELIALEPLGNLNLKAMQETKK